MKRDIFEEIGTRTPYLTPDGFSAAMLMDRAIAADRRRTKRGRWMWSGAVVAAAASVAALIGLSVLRSADPVGDYDNALANYLEQATEADILHRQDIADADIMNHLDTYEEYYYGDM